VGGRITEREIWVRSTDMDADGVVNNARYFEFFEQARLEHLVALDIVTRPRPLAGVRTFTIAETRCRYLAPLRYRDTVRGQAWTEEVGKRSFVLAYRLVLAGSGVVAAEGSSAQVWLDGEGHAAPLPDGVRAALLASMGGDGESGVLAGDD
jgi:acyl-CoA thioester hydrolase